MNYFNYFTEIEETFVRRRGKHLLLSPLDWALIDDWKSRGIPLHIVIRAVESVFDVFDKQPPGTRTIKSLFYCREEVETQFGEWAASQAGKGNDDATQADGLSPEAVRSHIAEAIVGLRAVESDGLAEDIARAIVRLEELSTGLSADLEAVDKTLGHIEQVLDRSLLANSPRETLKSFEKEIAAQLRAYKAEMEAEAYRRTFEIMLLKRLREEAGVPRLGLYYL